MFGFFKSRKSPVRQRLEASVSVHRTWVEWTIEDGKAEPILVVEFAYETDPGAPNFDREGIDEVVAAIAATEPGEIAPAWVRLIPRMHD